MVVRDYFVEGAASPTDLPTGTTEGCVASACCTFVKGFTPPPFQIVSFDEGKGIRIIFEEHSSIVDCVCEIECIGIPSIVLPDAITTRFCPKDLNNVFDINITALTTTTIGDPFLLNFTFTDPVANVSTIKVFSLSLVRPSPLIYRQYEENGSKIEIGIPSTSILGTDLRPYIAQYQVEEYIGNPLNTRIALDWTKPSNTGGTVSYVQRTDDVFVKALKAGDTYGYRVRYRSVYDEASLWGVWVVVTA